METQPEANAPTTVPAPAPVAPVALPANNLSSQNGAPTGSEVVDIDKLSSADLDQATDALRNHIPADAKGKALDKAREVVAKGTPAELEEQEVVPPVIEPAPEPAPGEPTAAEVIPPAPANPAPEPEPETGKSPQRRVRGEKPEDDMALDIFQTRQRIGKPISMLEASLEANRILGIGDDAPEPVAPPKSVSAAETELAALRETRKAAKIAFDSDAEEAAQTAIEAKIEEIRDIKQDSIARSQRQQHEVQSAKQASTNQAVDLYPDVLPDPVTRAVSPVGQRLLASKDLIWAQHVANNDPVVNDPNYPLILLQMAAAREGVAPKIPGQPAAPSKPVPSRSVQPAKPVAPLASATARTTQPTKGQAVEAALDGMSGRQLDEIVSALSPHLRRS